VEEAIAAGRRLVEAGPRAVLVKGGHLELATGEAVDVLVEADGGVTCFSAARVGTPGRAVRGTGCALATAIAVLLATGRPLPEAIAAAKGWLLARLPRAIDVGGERHLP
jgi:hydroxymethylpyrimidine/phosphomethylpyrimidine kinase